MSEVVANIDAAASKPADSPAVLEDAAAIVQLQRLMPRVAKHRDHVLPVLLGASLFVHATVLLPTLLRHDDEAASAPKEIPVEVVQLPPPKPPAPKAPAQKPPAPKAPVQQAQQKPPPKMAEAKPKPPPANPEPKASTQKSGSDRLKDLLGPMPAVAMPGSTADGSDAVSYSQLVLSKVAKAKKEGRYAGIPGAASVSFKLGDAGEVASVEIVRPSGDPSLDAEAIAMIKRGAPYPPPLPGARRDFTITLRFQAVI